MVNRPLMNFADRMGESSTVGTWVEADEVGGTLASPCVGVAIPPFGRQNSSGRQAIFPAIGLHTR